MGAANGDKWLIWLLIIVVLLSIPASAQVINCTVTQSGGVTQYSVPELNAINCKYLWNNKSGYALANEKEEGDSVLKNTIWSLQTNQCFENISYVRTCSSERMQITATCTTSCSGNAENQGGKGTTHYHWIIPTVVVISVMLLVILLCCRYRKHQYLNHRPNAADEEAQL